MMPRNLRIKALSLQELIRFFQKAVNKTGLKGLKGL